VFNLVCGAQYHCKDDLLRDRGVKEEFFTGIGAVGRYMLAIHDKKSLEQI